MINKFRIRRCMFLMIALLWASPSIASTDIAIEHAWTPQGPMTMTMHAGYFMLTNHTADTLELISVSSDHYGQIEIHKADMVDGLSSMRKLNKLAVLSHEKVVFSPGGLHLMMRDPLKRLQLGDTFIVRLESESDIIKEFTMHVAQRHMQPATSHHGHP